MLARFLIDGPIVQGTSRQLEGDELHHAARVVRVRRGEKIEVFDGRGAAAEALIIEASKDRVQIEIGSNVPSRESSIEIILAAALIAPDKYELVLQKGCELGVSRFTPVITERVETRVERVLGKMDRWKRIILEATKQCGRSVLPRLDEPVEYQALVAAETGLVVFDADEPSDAWPKPTNGRLTIVIGPEGGMTPDEIDHARNAGAAICSLGPRRLRAETASIAAVTIAGTRLREM